MQAAIFALSAALSLAASVLLVSRLERVGERIGLSEALLGLLAALAADCPEITAAVAAIAGGHATVGIGVTLGSNVFNLAALLGLSALIAGRIGLHRRAVILEGGVGLWIALLSLVVVGGLVQPAVGLLLALVAFVPYVAFSAQHPAARARLRLPGRWSDWLAHALADEESDLAVAVHPRRGDRRDAAVTLGAVLVVVVASVAMERAATGLGADAGLAPIVVGGLVLAAVTSLPNAVAAVYLAARGRGAATLSEAFNSNALNVIVGLLLPGTILGLAQPQAEGLFVALSCVALTAWAAALALRGRGLDRRAGSLIVAGYLVFAALLATR
jgi:cation:H+ antiporter